MKTEVLHLLLLSAVAGGLCSCREKTAPAAAPGTVSAPAAPAETSSLKAADTPVLRIEPGDEWRYKVTIRNPKEEKSARPVVGSYERVRRFVGKVDPGEGRPPTDCFEVFSPGSAKMREFVEIQPEKVSLRGQSIVGEDGVQHSLIWYETPIPFFSAGLAGGETLPPIRVGSGEKNLWTTKVIGRETTEVAAGKFDAVRLQMIGVDGEVGIRRTYWFSPGVGIVREETVQESMEEVPLLIESQELLRVTRSGQ